MVSVKSVGRAALVILVLVVLLSPRPYAGVSSMSAFAAQQAGTEQHDITYCTAGRAALKMDVFFPAVSSPDPAPVALYVHGGGWTTGTREWISSILDPHVLTGRGFLVADIDYRLAPEYKWPAQIEDVKCAVRYLRASAQLYHLDPARIGVFGESAGGQLAALAGLAGQPAGFEGTGGYMDQSSRVQAVIDVSGPSDFTTFDVNSYTGRLSATLLGVKGVKSALQAASPVNYIDGDAPPFLIIHGEDDLLVPADQARELYGRLVAAGDSASLVIIKHDGHVFEPAGGVPTPSIADVRATMLDFFEKTLRKGPLASTYFSQTGKVVRSSLLGYWQEHGGLAQLGYPISEEIEEQSEADGKPYTVQYFERAVLERHPENKPPYNIQLSLLGSFSYREKYPSGAPGQQPNYSADSVLFAKTGHRSGGAFLEYWRTHGGLALQGYPISDEFTEVSALDGKPYTVQYYERAVFEFHPENPPQTRVLLSQLGRLQYSQKYAPGVR